MRCLGFLLLLAVANWNVGTLALAAELPQSPLLSRPDGGISEDIYSELVLFTKYSSAIYQFICPRPLGNTLINSVRPATQTATVALLIMTGKSSRTSSHTLMGSLRVTRRARR